MCMLNYKRISCTKMTEQKKKEKNSISLQVAAVSLVLINNLPE